MGFETLTPEFCYMNYSDNDVYGVQNTVTITSDFTNPEYMYDNTSEKQATINAFSGTKTHEVLFGQERTVTSLKLLNMNFKAFTLQLREGAGTWITVYTATNFTDDNLHFYQAPGEGYLLVTDTGDYLETTFGLLLTTSMRYEGFRLTVTELQSGEGTAKIGECYVGARAFKNSVGRVLDFREKRIDFRRNVISSWAGKAYSTRSIATYGAEIMFRVTDYEEYRFLEDLAVLGGDYTFFPTAGEGGSEISPSFSKNDIYLVQSDSDWSATPWGMNALQRINISILETEYVNT